VFSHTTAAATASTAGKPASQRAKQSSFTHGLLPSLSHTAQLASLLGEACREAVSDMFNCQKPEDTLTDVRSNELSDIPPRYMHFIISLSANTNEKRSGYVIMVFILFLNHLLWICRNVINMNFTVYAMACDFI